MFYNANTVDEEIWNVFDQTASDFTGETASANFSVSNVCQQHSQFVTDYTSGSKICGKCGVIVKKMMIDQEAEWRNLESNNQFSNDPIRCSVVNPMLPNSSLSTKIVTRGKESSHLARLNRWQSMPHSERSVYDVFQELDHKGREHNVSNVVLMAAKQFYLRVYQKNSDLLLKGEKREGLRGGKRQGLIAACLLFASKQCGTPLSQTQIAEVLTYKKSDVTRGSKIFLNLIKNDIDLNDSTIIDGHHFVRHFGMMLDVEYSVIKYAIEVYDYVKKMGLLSGNTAPSIASGCLFLVLKSISPDLHESIVAQTCGISKVTVLNVYKQLLPHRTLLLSHIFSNYYCHKLQIDNPITVDKIQKLCKVLSSTGCFDDIHPQVLSGAVVYYIMSRLPQTGTPFKTRFWETLAPWTPSDFLECAKRLIFYENAIVNFYFNYPILPKPLKPESIIHRSLKRERDPDPDPDTNDEHIQPTPVEPPLVVVQTVSNKKKARKT